MRGIYALAGFLGVNFTLWRTGRPTLCTDLRRIPEPLRTAGVAAFAVGFWRHLRRP